MDYPMFIVLNQKWNPLVYKGLIESNNKWLIMTRKCYDHTDRRPASVIFLHLLGKNKINGFSGPPSSVSMPLICLNLNKKGGLINFIQMSKSKYQHFYPHAFLKKLRLKKRIVSRAIFFKKNRWGRQGCCFFFSPKTDEAFFFLNKIEWNFFDERKSLQIDRTWLKKFAYLSNSKKVNQINCCEAILANTLDLTGQNLSSCYSPGVGALLQMTSA